MSDQDNIFSIKYRFIFDNGLQKIFNIELDEDNLNLISSPDKIHPDWTRLSCNKCPNCPLKEDEHKYCPVAVNLEDVIDFLSKYLSYDEVTVEIFTKQRTYAKRVPIATAATSLIGICMVTNECPIMSKLKPMVRFHLPFASEFETKYRAISMYLLSQFLLYKKGNTPDWEMKNLGDIYKDINIVNKAFSERLQVLNVMDSSLNAILNLDCFAYSVQFSIDSQTFDDIEPLFKAYL